MNTLMVLAVVSVLFSLALTPVCRNLARRFGVLDYPDKNRKRHLQPIPRIGGVPILLVYSATCTLLLLLPATNLIRHSLDLALVWKFAPAVLIVFFAGLLDDWIGLKPWHKLTAQILASVWAYWAGVRIDSIAGLHIHPLIALPLTIVWLIGCTNAFNLIDGLDGLASGVGLFATTTILIAALIQGNVSLALVTMPLAGALLGFLRYNFTPATVFLGDSGSLLIGFLLGSFGVVWSQKSATLLGITAPLMALALPLLDAGLSIVRRFLRKQPILVGDRGHIHHRLLDRGFTPRRVSLILYAFCGVGAALAVLQSVANNHMGGMVILLFCGIAWIGVQNLGYAEFGLARRLVLRDGFRHALNTELQLRELESAIAASQSLDECWTAILEVCRAFDFVEARWHTPGRNFEERLRESNGDFRWMLRIPLSDTSYISLWRLHNSTASPVSIVPFVGVIHRGLAAKIPQLASGDMVLAQSNGTLQKAISKAATF